MYRIGFVIAFVLMQVCTASADPMTFRLFQALADFTEPSEQKTCTNFGFTDYNGPSTPQTIYADGEITAGTAERFTAFLQRNKGCIKPGAWVVFNSPGGNIIQGIQLGYAIRAGRFNTTIARRGDRSEEPGYCLSACTMSFLGGVNRHPGPAGSVYGVHQFYSDSQGIDMGSVQQVSALILLFVREMGTDPNYFTAMVQAGRNEVLPLTPPQMAELKITTTDGAVRWQVVPQDGAFVARATITHGRGKEQTVEFDCRNDPSSGRRRLGLTFKLDDVVEPVQTVGLNAEFPVKQNSVVLTGMDENWTNDTRIDLTSRVRTQDAVKIGLETLNVDATPDILDLFRRKARVMLSVERRGSGLGLGGGSLVPASRGSVVVPIGRDRQPLLDYLDACR